MAEREDTPSDRKSEEESHSGDEEGEGGHQLEKSVEASSSGESEKAVGQGKREERLKRLRELHLRRVCRR